MRDSVLRRLVEALVPLSTLALALMPLLALPAVVMIIAFWLTTLVARSALDPTPMRPDAWKWTAFLALPFLIMLVDMLRADSLPIGWAAVERSASLAVFPVGFMLLGAPASDRFREAMMDLFALAALLLAVYANGLLLLDGFPPGADPQTSFSHAYRIAFSDFTGLHPPYGSYFFLSAALFQLDRIIDLARRPWWRLLAIALLFFASLLLASRMPLIAFAAAASVILFVRLPRSGAIRWALGVFTTVCVLALVVPGVRERVGEAVATLRGQAPRTHLNSVNVRLPIAQCSLELIEENWLFGVGQASAQRSLDQCYLRFDEPMLMDGSYGTHNQLLHWWLCFGVTGLALYIVYFGTLLITAWQRKDAVHLGFIVLIILCCATENILNRQWGVVLFASFNALFLAGSPDPRPLPPPRT